MRHSHATDLIYSLGWITLSFFLNAVQWNACSLQRVCEAAWVTDVQCAVSAIKVLTGSPGELYLIGDIRMGHWDFEERFPPEKYLQIEVTTPWSGGREGGFFHGHILKIEKRFKVYFIVSRATNKTPLSKKHSPAFEVVLTLQIGSCKWANCLSLGDNL